MLQSLSSASSSHSRHDEVLPHGEAQTSNALPIDSSPEARQDQNLDPPRLSQGIMMLNKWIPTRMKKTKKDPALIDPDRVPRKVHQAADHHSRSRSRTWVEDSSVGPSRMAATKRVPVSVLDTQSGAVCPTYHLSEWSRHLSKHNRSVSPPLCRQGLIDRCSLMPSPLVKKKVLLIADEIQRKQIMCVFFLVMVDHIMTAHVPLGTTNERSISFLVREDPSNGARTFV